MHSIATRRRQTNNQLLAAVEGVNMKTIRAWYRRKQSVARLTHALQHCGSEESRELVGCVIQAVKHRHEIFYSGRLRNFRTKRVATIIIH
jgi:hypothetical protein